MADQAHFVGSKKQKMAVSAPIPPRAGLYRRQDREKRATVRNERAIVFVTGIPISTLGVVHGTCWRL